MTALNSLKLVYKFFSPHSPSDLEADDEDNQEFDSLNQSDSTVSSLMHVAEAPCRPRPGTPTGDNPEEVSSGFIHRFNVMISDWLWGA